MEATVETMMPTRRMGIESSETRAQLIEAAAQIVRKDGYGAVTARRLAEMVGLKRPTVHYYFRTIEDLLIAVIRRDGERLFARLSQEMDSGDPLRVIWESSQNSKAVILEFLALASHRKAVQVEVKRFMEELRRYETQALMRYMKHRGIEPTIPPVAMLFAMVSISVTRAIESTVGVSVGHAEIKEVVEQWLRVFEKQGGAPKRRSASKKPKNPKAAASARPRTSVGTGA